MKKLTQSAMQKKIYLLLFFISIQMVSFANSGPSVYNSELNLSDLSVKEVIEQPWVWVLLAGVVVIAILALIGAKDAKHHSNAH